MRKEPKTERKRSEKIKHFISFVSSLALPCLLQSVLIISVLIHWTNSCSVSNLEWLGQLLYSFMLDNMSSYLISAKNETLLYFDKLYIYIHTLISVYSIVRSPPSLVPFRYHIFDPLYLIHHPPTHFSSDNHHSVWQTFSTASLVPSLELSFWMSDMHIRSCYHWTDSPNSE